MSGNNTKLTASAQGTAGSTKRSTNKKQLFILVGMISTCLLLVVCVVLVKFGGQLSANQCRGTNESPIYNEANHAMAQLFKDDLQNVVTKIKKQKNYQADANCLYPIVVHYIRKGDAKNAQFYYDKMQQSFNSKLGFAAVYGLEGAKTIHEMAPAVANLKIKEELRDSPKLPSVY